MRGSEAEHLLDGVLDGGIHAILETPDKREVGSSSLPRPIRLMGCRGSDSRCRFPPNGMGNSPLRRFEGLP